MSIFRFKPLLQETIWGGNKIAEMKHLDTAGASIGESWELSGVKGHETVVAEGKYEGMPLNTLVNKMGAQLVGEANYQRFGDTFPLLIKFIDARDDLSIQVHPDDATAHRQGKACGKTEMWYAMESAPDAKLYNGLKSAISPETFARKVADNTITDALAQYPVGEGDVFFIPAGRVHAIGKGCFVAEIQQTSDVTYRIYDFDRRDKNGNRRQLHTSEAAECIDYSVLPDYRTHYDPNQSVRTRIASCRYFTTNVITATSFVNLNCLHIYSFIILICVKGEGRVTLTDGESCGIKAGETVLLPATTEYYYIEGETTLLETYIA